MPAPQYNYDYYEYGNARRGTVKAAPRLADSKRTTATKKATSSNTTTSTRKATSTRTAVNKTATTRTTTKKVTQQSDNIAKRAAATKATNRASVRATLNADVKTTSRNAATRANRSNSKNLDVPNIVSKKQLQKPKEMSLKNAEVAVTAKQKAKAKAEKKQKIVNNVAFSLCCFSILFLICYRSSVINESFKDLNSMKSELERVNTINAQIESEIQTQTDLSNIETYAKYQLGMQKPKDSQIQKVVIEKEDKISTPVIIEDEDESFWDNFVNDIINILD